MNDCTKNFNGSFTKDSSQNSPTEQIYLHEPRGYKIGNKKNKNNRNKNQAALFAITFALILQNIKAQRKNAAKQNKAEVIRET